MEQSRGVTLPLWDDERLLSEDERAGRVVRAAVLEAFPGNEPRWFHKPINIPAALRHRFGDDQWDEGAEWFWNAWRSVFPDSRQVVALRHPCDVIVSQSKWTGLSPAELWEPYAFLMHVCAHPSAPELHVSHYDGLLADPETAVRAMLEAVDMPFEPQVMRAFDSVHVAAPDRRGGSGSFGSRRPQWDVLEASDLDPAHKAAVNDAFARMGHSIDWPHHLENPSGRPLTGLPERGQAGQQIDEVDRLKKQLRLAKNELLGVRRHEREESQRWKNFVNRNRHLLPLSRDLEVELDRQLTTFRGETNAPRDGEVGGESETPEAPEATVPSTALVLPSGLTHGNVTEWAVELAGLLTPPETVCIIRHPDDGAPLDIELPAAMPVVLAKSLPYPLESRVERYASEYARVLPATLVPNYNHAGYALIAELSKSRASDVRTIGFAHADELQYYSLLEYYEPMIHRFVAATEEIGSTLRQLLPERNDDIEVRHVGVSVDDDVLPAQSSEGNPLRLCYVGPIEHGDVRILSLVQLARLLVRRGVPFTLDIVGDGPARHDLEVRLQEVANELEGRVVHHADVSRAGQADFWANHDVFVSLATTNVAARSMLQAMAHGCPPVVIKESDGLGAVEDGVNGFATTTDDVPALGARLIELDADRDRLMEMAQAAHATVLERYNSEVYAGAFTALSAQMWELEPRAWPDERSVLPENRRDHEAAIERRLADIRAGRLS